MGPDLLPEFTRYYLLSAKEYAESLASGTTFKELSGKRMAELELPVPPLGVQRRIVAKLDALLAHSRAAREQLEAVPALVDTYRQSVLAAAFRGDLTADWRKKNPNVEPASKLLERIRLERRSAWEAAELAKMTAKGKPPKDDKWKSKYVEPAPVEPRNLPALPANWCWANVGELITEPLCNGLSVKGRESPPGVAALKLNAMAKPGLDYAAVRYLPVAWTDVSDLAIRANDFFVCRGNGSLDLVGRGILARQPPINVIFPDTMIRLRPTSILSSGWLPLVWANHSVRSQIEARVKTTAGIYKISQPQIESIVVPLAPGAEQDRIVTQCQTALGAISGFLDPTAQLSAELERGFLAKAFSGRLAV